MNEKLDSLEARADAKKLQAQKSSTDESLSIREASATEPAS
jgi:hypothetical protein